MITNKLKIIFGLSIPLFIVHGIEGFMTHFQDVDAHDQKIFGLLNGLSNHGATFVTFQVMLWLLLIISFLLLIGQRWQFNILAIVGLVYIYELHHIYKALITGGYYPGLYTALLFPVVAVFFWKEWLKIYKN
ncbi:MAG: HXXEE domain-containing protein [Candidatus Taylorbacteria bacterium]|nr:HXXEE domain-containing protein [Candidatus Taylorbacteria bacterium]